MKNQKTHRRDAQKKKLQCLNVPLFDLTPRPTIQLILIFKKSKNAETKEKHKPKRHLIIATVLWQFLTSPTTIAFSSGIIAFASVFFMYKQTKLLDIQNDLFKAQNKRIDQQTQLEEAARRSSQMFIMGEVLSDLNRELEDPKNTKKTLSNTLVGRIISLSRAMKPYKYLYNDSLTKKTLSPERGQLLLSLIESKMDSTFFLNRIIKNADFSYSDLVRSNLKGINLSGIDLRNSNLRQSQLNNTNLTGANLYNVDLTNADLNGTNLSGAVLYETELKGAGLKNIIFSGSTLDRLDLSQVQLFNADLKGVSLVGSNLSDAFLTGADFSNADLSGANLSGANLKDVNFNNTILYKANLTDSYCYNTKFNTNLTYVDLTSADLSNSIFQNVDFSKTLSLNNCLVNRKDWIEYLKDSLKIKGGEKIYDLYEIKEINGGPYGSSYQLVLK